MADTDHWIHHLLNNEILKQDFNNPVLFNLIYSETFLESTIQVLQFYAIFFRPDGKHYPSQTLD